MMVCQKVCLSFLLIYLTSVTSSKIYRTEDLAVEASRNVERDLEAAASGHYGHGRVQIKVYRGPNEGGHDHFAPHGYWVKQPADDHH